MTHIAVKFKSGKEYCSHIYYKKIVLFANLFFIEIGSNNYCALNS